MKTTKLPKITKRNPCGVTHASGRTLAEAYAAGDCFSIVWREGDDPRGAWRGEYNPIACGSVEEVLRCARRLFPDRIGRKVFAQRLIGPYHVEDAGTYVL